MRNRFKLAIYFIRELFKMLFVNFFLIFCICFGDSKLVDCPDYTDQVKISNDTCCSSSTVDVYNSNMTIFPENSVNYSLCAKIRDVNSLIFWTNCIVMLDCDMLALILPNLRWITFIPDCFEPCHKLNKCFAQYYVSGKEKCTLPPSKTTTPIPEFSTPSYQNSSSVLTGSLLSVVFVATGLVGGCFLIWYIRKKTGRVGVTEEELQEITRVSPNAALFYDISLTNFVNLSKSSYQHGSSENLIFDPYNTASSLFAANVLNCSVETDLSKEDLLSKMSKSRVIHLNLSIWQNANSIVGFKLGAVRANNDDSVDSQADEFLSQEDILSANLEADVCVITAATKCENRRLLTDFAQTLNLAGCQIVICINSADERARSKLVEEFYDYAFVQRQNVALFNFSNYPNAEFFVYGNCSLKIDHKSMTKINRPLRQMLKTPDECREAFAVIFHLIVKSLDRINKGVSTPMFFTEQSVRNKAGPEVSGVFELLESFGFQRGDISKTQKSNDESLLYFPLNDPMGNLNRGSNVLQAFLSLPQGVYVAFNKLINDDCSAVKLLNMLEAVEKDICSSKKLQNYELKVKRNLYRINGAVELFAALGFDKLKEIEDEIILESIRVELTNKKLQNTLICLRSILEDCRHLLNTSLCPIENSENQAWSSSSLPRRTSSVTTAEQSNLNIVSPTNPNSVSNFQDLDILPTDLSGVDSDFPLDESLWAMSLERAPKKSSSRQQRRIGGKLKKSMGKKNSSGYMSEGDLKRGKSTKIDESSAGSRGYHSEDENKSFKPLSAAGNNSPLNDSVFESTAQVISVDERDSPTLNDTTDLGFHDSVEEFVSPNRNYSNHNVNAINHVPAFIAPANQISKRRSISPPPFAPPPVPPLLWKQPHEYARLETPSPFYSVRPPPPSYETHLHINHSNVGYHDNATGYHGNNNDSFVSNDAEADAIRRAAQKFAFQRQSSRNSSINNGNFVPTTNYAKLPLHSSNNNGSQFVGKLPNNNGNGQFVAKSPTNANVGNSPNRFTPTVFSRVSPRSHISHNNGNSYNYNVNSRNMHSVNKNYGGDRLIVTREDSLQSEFI